MSLFDFLKKKKTLTDEDIEKEYQKAQRKVQSRRTLSFEHAIERFAQKECMPQKGDDVLNLKAKFIHYYSYTSRMDCCYHTLKYKKGQFSSSPLWCQKWHDYEQDARLQAQRRWREITSHTR